MPNVHRNFTADRFPCPAPHFNHRFKTSRGLKRHRQDTHNLDHPHTPAALDDPIDDPPQDDFHSPPPSLGPEPPPSPPPVQTIPPNCCDTDIEYHPILDINIVPHAIGMAMTCLQVHSLLCGKERAADDFSPFNSCAEFEFADFLYCEEEMVDRRVDCLSQLLATLYQGINPPFADHKDLYSTINTIQQGDMPWQSFSVTYTGLLPESGDVPAWMTEKYKVWYRSPLAIFEKQLANPDFNDEMDWAPKQIFKDGKCQYVDLFSGNWAWEQADKIVEDKNTHGAMYVPSVLSSDKTTVSVGTGNTEFYPFYSRVGNLHHAARGPHREGLAVITFLSILKTTHDPSGSMALCKFHQQLFRSSLHKILSPLKPHMTIPCITHCTDGHCCQAIYGLGPYIADYPEQALLACIVQNWCARCLSHATDLDRPSAPRSHEHTDILMEGCTLKELGDHFGIVGDFIDHVVDWIKTYIRNNNEKAEADRILMDIDRSAVRIAITPPFPGLHHFHTGRGYKQWTGNDSKGLMKMFGAPNRLCSSITESKHIKAIKKPYRHTNHNKPLSQILLTNQRLDKLVAAQINFTACDMMD
ncbi:hypothetical protein B0H10DRAFT_1948157 [Mycena sp. CBHHK59/15]|nr:hypothetical protein B0H10DRAFT_1948157 [Mycena sp. CBHHK59/15]